MELVPKSIALLLVLTFELLPMRTAYGAPVQDAT